MDNNTIKVSMSYITNFKPSNFLDFKNMKIFKNKNKNKLISRNFFLFLLLLKYTSFNSNFLTVSIFIKPFYKKFITILRAPYRHKLSRHQFILSRYYLVYSIKIKTTTPNFTQNLEIIHFLKKIKRFYV